MANRRTAAIAAAGLCYALLLCLCHCTPPVVTGKGPAVSIWPPAGAVKPGTEITLTSAPGAQIYYTLDDTPPSPSRGYLYSGAFGLWGTSTVRCVAVDDKGRVGAPASARYDLDIYPPLSMITPPPGNKRGPTQISFDTNADATVYFTTDGSRPTLRSRAYTAPFSIDRDTVVRYFAADRAGNRELIQRASYNFAPILTVEPPSGLYAEMPLKIVASSNETALIQYRLLTPPGAWQPYQDGIAIRKDARIQIASTDLSGLSTSLTRDYGLRRPLETKAAKIAELAGQEVLATALIDLEGLGQPRLLVATKAALYSIPRAKDGGWAAPTKLADLAFTTRFLRVWDLDGDGLSDVMLGDQKGGLHLYRSLAATLLQAEPTLLGPWTPAEGLQMIVPIDVDANGQLDVFLLDQRAGRSRIAQRSSRGYLLPSLIDPPIEAGAVGALSADLDGDDDIDLLILPGQQKAPYILVNDGVGRFTRLSLAEALGAPTDIAWLHAARSDLDLDGDLDLLLVGRGPAPATAQAPIKPGETSLHVVMLRHHGSGQWALEERWLGADMPLRGVTLLDIDADGHDDLVLLPQAAEKDARPVVIKQLLGRRLMTLPFAKAQAVWPAAVAATAADVAVDGALALLLIQPDGDTQRISYLPEKPTFLRLVIQGIRGNRNAIGARISTRAGGRFSRRKELGIRHTGPDQTELLLPIHFGGPEEIGALIIRWPDGLRREIPAPTVNDTMIISPP